MEVKITTPEVLKQFFIWPFVFTQSTKAGPSLDLGFILTNSRAIISKIGRIFFENKE